jgi:hypothetical protein
MNETCVYSWFNSQYGCEQYKNNTKQGMSTSMMVEQILLVREFWKAKKGNYKLANVNTSRLFKKKWIVPTSHILTRAHSTIPLQSNSSLLRLSIYSTVSQHSK